MTSVAKTTALVLEKHDGEELSPRVRELRVKIQDKDYIDMAIGRIAQVISRRLVEEPETLVVHGGNFPVPVQRWQER
ncbi:MAG: hypothetical protein IJ191_02200 [Treponema sp.]|nr:hypothetical protein [Treponema sp.]